MMLRNVLILVLICVLIVACGGNGDVTIVYRDCIGIIDDGIVCTHCTLDDVGDPPPGCTYEEQVR